MQTIVIDLDGVIADGTEEEVYSDEAGWAFEKCHVKEGAREGLRKLSENYRLILDTARWKTDIPKTAEWLRKNNLMQFFDEIRIGEKPTAKLYIDDKAYRFEGWHKLLDEVGGILGEEFDDTGSC